MKPPQEPPDQPADDESGPAGLPQTPPTPTAPEQLLPQHIREALSRANLNPQEIVLIEAAFRFSRSSWPPPDVVEGYERAVPGMGKAIITAINARIQARTQREDNEADRADQRMRRAQTFGFCIAAGSLVLAGVLGLFGKGWIAAVIAVVGLIIGVGGPSVARVLADKIYLDLRSQQPPKRAKPPTKK